MTKRKNWNKTPPHFDQLEVLRPRPTIWDWTEYHIQTKQCGFSAALEKEIHRRFRAATKYLSQTTESIQQIAQEYDISIFLIRKFATDLLQGTDILIITKHQLKYAGKLGLELAMVVLRKYHTEHGKLPSNQAKGMGGIMNTIQRGDWKQHGITTWNDMMRLTFGETNLDPYVYIGDKGLVRAKMKLQKFYKKLQRLPTSTDSGLGGIRQAIQREEWVTSGIHVWNDLLWDTFHQINHRKNVYKRKEGLDLAIRELREFYLKHQRMPKLNDPGMVSLKVAINRDEWGLYGINEWNDLLLKTFGKVHRNKYRGRKGLNRAIQELREFHKKNQRVPKPIDEGMVGIIGVINRRGWVKYNISSWRELLLKALGHRYKSYHGEEGLFQAMDELRVFYHQNKRKPKYNEPKLREVRLALRRGQWTSWGITTWTSLIKRAFTK